MLVFGFTVPERAGSVAREFTIQAKLAPRESVPVRRPTASLARPLPAALHELSSSGAPALLPAGEGAIEEPLPSPASIAAADARRSFAETGVNVDVPLPDPVHYAARELDVYPRALRPIVPAYPHASGEAHLPGSVTLLVMIDEGGRVTGSSVVDATPGEAFDDAARAAVGATPFYPAQRAGHAVRSQLLIKVEFDPATQ